MPEETSTVQNSAPKPGVLKNPAIRNILIMLGVLAVAGSIAFLRVASTKISIDKSQISAPSIALAPTVSGTLNSISVNEGDTIDADTVVAQVGNELIKSKTAGLVIAVNNNIGTIFNPGEAVVTIIDPSELRVIGQIEENKGLADIRIGQQASFTVDAFGSKSYDGFVDEISPTSHDSGVVFNISDQRETKIFDIKVRFDVSKYPELKNGMSAKLTIYK